jgi:hypothetical protein
MTDFTETRSMLKKLAIKEGPYTPAGRVCYNILEATENLAKATDPEQRLQLVASIERQKLLLNSALLWSQR